MDIIFGGSSDTLTLISADVNEDGEINLADVNVIIDMILQ